MSYTHKLARRLAQVHLIAFAMVFVACGDSASPLNESAVSPDTNQIQLSSLSALGSQSPLAPNANPNEPAGYVRFAEIDLSTLPNGLWKPLGQAGQWSWFPVGDPDLTLGSTTVPGMASAPDYMSTRFPKGLKSSYAPVNFGGWQNRTAYKSKVYLSVWMRIRGTSFENQAVGTKLGFMSYGDGSAGTRNQGYFMLQGAAKQGVYSSFAIKFTQQNIVNRNLYPNIDGSKLFTAGPWHHVEAVMEINSLGQANGKMKMWIDGTRVMDYSNVVYIKPGKTEKFNYWIWNPTWGGVGGTRTRDDFIDIDHVYMSGLP